MKINNYHFNKLLIALLITLSATLSAAESVVTEEDSVNEAITTEKDSASDPTSTEENSGTEHMATEDDFAEVDLLPDITVVGRYERPGSVSLEPGSGGTLDTASLLERVPGGAVNRNGPLTGIAAYRGMFGERVNVMVDGMALRTAGPNSMDTPMSYVPKTMTRKIKVYRGIAPVSSGIETLGGTIITESRRSEFSDDGFDINAFMTGGYSWVNAGKYASVIGSVANENHRFHAAGSWERGRDYVGGKNTHVRPTRYERTSWSVGYGFQMNDQEFYIDYDNKDTGWTGTPSLPMDIIGVRSDVVNTGFNGLLGGVDYHVGGFYQNASHDMDNHTMRLVPTPGGRARYRNQHTWLEAGGYNANATVHEVLGGDLKVGVDGLMANNNSNIKDPTNARFFLDNFNNAERNVYSGFAEWNGAIADQWDLEAGIRYNYIHMNADAVSTSIGLPPIQRLASRFNSRNRSRSYSNVDGALTVRYAPLESLDVELGFASKTRAPNYQERFLWAPLEATGGLADGRVYVGNLDLASERSYDVELGLDWHGDNFYASPRLFYRYVDDYIQGLPSLDPTEIMVARATQPGGPGPLKYSNINAQLYGIDMEAGYVLNENWRVDGLISYVRGERVGSISDNLYRIAPLNGRLKLTWNYAVWESYLEFVGAISQSSVSRYNGERPSAGWALANFRVQLQPEYKYVKGLTMAFGVENIFDKRYANHLNGINRARNSDVPIGLRVLSPGRNIYLSASYEID